MSCGSDQAAFATPHAACLPPPPHPPTPAHHNHLTCITHLPCCVICLRTPPPTTPTHDHNHHPHTQIVDMFAAATYLAGALEPWVALIVFVTIGSYIPLTIIVTEWRGNFRREMNRTENARSARVTDALLNWCVVLFFGGNRGRGGWLATGEELGVGVGAGGSRAGELTTQSLHMNACVQG